MTPEPGIDGLAVAAGGECCGQCGGVLAATEHYLATPDGDGHTAAGLPRPPTLCLGCAVLVGAL